MTSFQFQRSDWFLLAKRIAGPVLETAAQARLSTDLPLAWGAGGEDRPNTAPLEALCRTLSGIAPWLDASTVPSEEQSYQTIFRELAHKALTSMSDPNSPDYLDVGVHEQGLVEAAILGQACLRAPKSLWYDLPGETQKNLVDLMHKARQHQPFYNNHLLFAAMIEAFFFMIGEPWDRMRVDYALRSHDAWYLGDGVYSDGPHFHYDYYQSFVIHPFLLTIGELLQNEREFDDWRDMVSKFQIRAGRSTVQQALSIAPDGTFPPIGRSLCYRSGAFHLLAFMSWQQRLPQGLNPASIRVALGAMINRCFQAADTFDQHGWLQLGLHGKQSEMADFYTNIGSLYLCLEAFLPLGLPMDAAFWSDPDEPTPWQTYWNSPTAKRDSYLERDPERYGGTGW